MHPNHLIETQREILTGTDRDRVLEWLQWNDRSGIYSDRDSEREGLTPLTLEAAKSLMREQIESGYGAEHLKAIDHPVPEGWAEIEA